MAVFKILVAIFSTFIKFLKNAERNNHIAKERKKRKNYQF